MSADILNAVYGEKKWYLDKRENCVGSMAASASRNVNGSGSGRIGFFLAGLF